MISPRKVLCGLTIFLIAHVAAATEAPLFRPVLTGSERASAIAWGDYDGDGWLDLAVALYDGEVRLYHNDHGKFVDVSVEMGLPTKSNGTALRDQPVALAWGDYNEDGRLDLYVGTIVFPGEAKTHLSRNYLYRNDSARGFVEVAAELGVDLPGGDTRQVSWIDYDNDGHPDLFVAQRSGYSRLFRNEGGHFRDVSVEAGLFDPRRTVGACWFDMDKDGYLDLFLANQNGDKDALYRNDHGKFTDIARERKMDQPLRTLAEGGVGCTVGDFENSGNLDLFVATYGQNLLYRNDGSGHFEEVAQQWGITGAVHAVGASWGDYDNDGHLDLYVAGYHLSETGYHPDDRLFHNEVNHFVNVLQDQGVINVADHGVQWADYDHDGHLDLALTNGANGGYWVLHNELPKDRQHQSLQVLVLDAQGHYTRAGAEVRLYDGQNKLIGTRLVSTGDGYNSQSAMPVHFGLSQQKPVTVEVTFLTQAGRQTQRLTGVDPKDWAGKFLIVKQDRMKQ